MTERYTNALPFLDRMVKPRLNDYARRGAYHWINYDHKPNYKKKVDRFLKMIPERGNQVLEVGCGDGLIAHKFDAIGIDVDPIAVKLALKKGVKAQVLDVMDLPGDLKPVFKWALMIDVLEHLVRPVEALRAVAGVAARVFIATPLAHPKKKLPPFHSIEYTEEELWKLLEYVGLEVDDHELMGRTMCALCTVKGMR